MDLSRTHSPVGYFDIIGKTYPYRSKLKSLNGKYNPKIKGWRFKNSDYNKVEQFLSTLIPKTLTTSLNLIITTEKAPSGFFFVIGNTYSYRKELKKLGGKWNFVNNAWMFETNKIMNVEDFISNLSTPFPELPPFKSAPTTPTHLGITHTNVPKVSKKSISKPPPTKPEFLTGKITSFDSKFLFDLFETAGKSLKYPKIRLFYKDKQIIMKKIANNIIRVYLFGMERTEKEIAIIFKKYISDKSGLNLVDLLKELKKQPLETISNFGFLTGRCPFCYKNLERKESVECGYGPVCARRYGLVPPY